MGSLPSWRSARARVALITLLGSCHAEGGSAPGDVDGALGATIDGRAPMDAAEDGDGAAAGDAAVDLPPDASVDRNDGNRSGSRLTVDFLGTDDGARQFWELHDTALQIGCWYTYTSAGLRCVPQTNPVDGFADADCVEPVTSWWPASCGAVPDYIEDGRRGENGYEIAHLWRRGPALTGTSIYTRSPDGSCAPSATHPYALYYVAGAEVPLATLVTGHWRRGVGATRLVQDYLEGGDGSRLAMGAWDTGLDTACSPRAPDLEENAFDFDGKELSCLPGTAWPRFRDAACEERIGCVLAGEAKYVEEVDFGTCPPTVTVHETAGELDLTTVYGPSGTNACEPDRVDPRGTCYGLGDQVPLTTFVTLRRMRDTTAPGRLQPYYDVAPDGFRRRPGGWYDTELDVICNVDGFSAAPRCVPYPEARLVVRYRDAGCSDAVDLAEQTLEDCPTPPARVASLWGTGGCDPVPTAYRLGDEWPSMTPLFFHDSNGVCRRVDRQAARYYAVGAEIPLSSFAVFTHRIEEPVSESR